MRDGILIINKPKGITSHDVVDCARQKLKMRRIGHAGTLDPMATGVLLILVGRSTKLFPLLLQLDKEYVAYLRLGIKTTSGDIDGRVIQTQGFGHISTEMIENVFSAYQGEILQVPPMVSALRFKGKRLYLLARRGIEVERRPRKVRIHELRLLEFHPPDIKFYLKCSSGTYVRKLGEDIAEGLDCVGHIAQLERMSVGPYYLSAAISPAEIEERHIIESYLVKRDLASFLNERDRFEKAG